MLLERAWVDRWAQLRAAERAAGADPAGAEMTSLLDALSADVRYVDVPTGGVWLGRDAFKGMIVKTSKSFSNDHVITVPTRLTDGVRFALEGEVRGTNIGAVGVRGRAFVLRWASVGTFDSEGRVQEARDYWDQKGWLIAIGADETKTDPTTGGET